MGKMDTKLQAILIIAIAVFASIISGLVLNRVAPQQMGVGIQTIPQNPFIITMNDTTANRAFNTTYTNLEGTAMIVHVYIRLRINTTGGGSAVATAYVNQSATPTTNMGQVRMDTLGGNMTILLAFYVPNLFRYRVNATTTGTGNAAIIRWFESIPPTSYGVSILSAFVIRREER